MAPATTGCSAPAWSVYVQGGSGRDMAYVNMFGMRYAHRHGVETVRKIHTHTL